MNVDTNTIKQAVGWVGYFGASTAVMSAVVSTMRGQHPVVQIASWVGGWGLGNAAGDVSRNSIMTTLDRL